MKTNFGAWLRGNIAETVIRIAASKVDFFKEGQKIDKLMDDALGGASEHIQRGTLTISISQLIKGLWAESPMALIAYYRQEADTIEKQEKPKGEKK